MRLYFFLATDVNHLSLTLSFSIAALKKERLLYEETMT